MKTSPGASPLPPGGQSSGRASHHQGAEIPTALHRLEQGSGSEVLRFRAKLEATIGDVCEVFGLTPRAVRFYEERGLLNPMRDSSNRRRYSLRDRARLEVIVLLRGAGVSISDISRLLDTAEPREALSQVASLISARIVELEREKAAALAAIAKLEQCFKR